MWLFQNLIACKATFYVLDYLNCSDAILSAIKNIHQSGWMDTDTRLTEWNDFINIFNEEYSLLSQKAAEKNLFVHIKLILYLTIRNYYKDECIQTGMLLSLAWLTVPAKYDIQTIIWVRE